MEIRTAPIHCRRLSHSEIQGLPYLKLNEIYGQYPKIIIFDRVDN